MARAGITKYQVEKAYQSLMTQGIHPSIDALRVELGNTGSKTTISRYLKELEAEQCVQMEDEALLSVGIKDLIAKLASKLHQEANDVVQQSKNGYQHSIKALEQDNIQLKQALESKALELEESRGEALSVNNTNETLNNKLSDLENTLTQSNSKTHELEAVIIEKDNQIQSLNENHQHTRDSLVHYRDSVKEQREQERRQHDQQVQQFQLELRQVNQTLIVKQGDITELNIDNSRLVTELTNLQKQLLTLEKKQNLTDSDLQRTQREQTVDKQKLIDSLKDQEKLKNELKVVFAENRTKEKDLRMAERYTLKLETEINTKSELWNQLQTVKL
jgi:chromosome segregation ATPase